MSSFTVCDGSLNAGEGERLGLGASESDRGFGGEGIGRKGAVLAARGPETCSEPCSVEEVPCDRSPRGISLIVAVDDMVKNLGEDELGQDRLIFHYMVNRTRGGS